MELSLGLSATKIRSPMNLSLSRACGWNPATVPASTFLSTRLHMDEMPKGRWNTGRQSQPGTRAVLPGKSGLKLAVLGADSAVGHHLQPFVMAEPHLSAVHLYSTDAVHICLDDRTHTKAFVGQAELAGCLKGMDVVMITAEPKGELGYVHWNDVFKVNACAVRPLVEAVALNCPNAFVLFVTRPINSLVPMAAQLMKNMGVYNPMKLIGIMKMQQMKVNRLIKELKGGRFLDYQVPVVGGNEWITVLPLISKSDPSVMLTLSEEVALTDKLMRSNTASFGLVDSYHKLLEARASYLFLQSLIRALCGESNVFESAFIESTVTSVPYFGSTVRLGEKGVEEVLPDALDGLTMHEMAILNSVEAKLMEDIKLGVEFAKNIDLSI